MKHLVLILVLIFVFRPLIPVIEYGLNYNKIVTEWCENRNTPEVLCNGKCYLSKELSKTSDSTTKKTENNNTFKNWCETFLPLDDRFIFTNNTVSDKLKSTMISTFILINFSSIHLNNIFHPPIEIMFV